MAYAAANVAAADLALAAADKPMLGALVVYSATAAEWRTSGSFASGSDGTASGYAASRAYDGYTDLVTKPSSSTTDWYYMLNLSAGSVSFDGVAILGHNFGTIGGLTVSLQIANNNAFSTNLITISQWSPGTSNARLIDIELESGGGTAQEYSDVEYIRLRVNGTSGAPEIGELALFNRTQLPWRPDRPYNKNATAQQATIRRSDSGVVTSYTRSRGAKKLSATLTVNGSSKIEEVHSWWDDTRQGTRPFVWLEEPYSNAQDLCLMSFAEDDPELQFDEIGPNIRELVLDAVEQGPDFERLE